MNIKYLLPIIIALVLSSCAVEPIAFFSVPTTAAPGDTVKPINYSVDANSYLWNFGDGNYATEESPKHTYTTGGNYNITLTAYAKNKKKSNSAIKTIFIDAVQKFLGSYNVSESCNGSPSSYLLNIFSTGTNQIILNNFTAWSLSLNADISGPNSFDIPPQDMGGGIIIQGSGTLSGSTITINYTFNSGGTITSCTATCIKQ